MILRIIEEAQEELLQAVDFLNGQRPCLGDSFAEEVFASFARLIEHPEAYPCVRQHTRRCIVRRFRYAVLYEIEEQEIVILAIMHMSRHPESWHDRLLGE